MSLSIKKPLFLIAILVISSIACAQTPAHKKRPGKTSGTISGKKLNDTVTIKDEKLGEIKIDMASVRKKAIAVTKQFSNYLTTLINPQTSNDDADQCIDQADRLFTRDARIQVSNANKIDSVHTYKIRRYLKNLKLSTTHYSKIEINVLDIMYVPEFKKGVDGNYYSVVTFVQRFKGFRENRVEYGDFTKKEVTVMLSTYEEGKNGEFKTGWKVYISNIAVLQTIKMVDTSIK